MQRIVTFALSTALLAGCSMSTNDATASGPGAAKPVFAAVETEPVQSDGDAADDPAIWLHPTDPSRSLVIGTNKKKGLDVYDLAGKRVQSLPDGRMNNVDLRYGFPLAGREVAIVAATNRTDKTLALYAVDATNGRLRSVADGAIATGMDDPYGLCMYRSRDGEYFVFANDGDSGAFKQWKLQARGEKVGAELVREFAVGSQAEGCAADDANARLYIAEEDVGLWRYSAAPNGGAERTKVDVVGKGGHLTDDAEGVAIFYGAGTGGYLLVSSQGSNEYNVYHRDGDNAFIGKFAIVEANGIDGTSDTDGIDVTSTLLGSSFPHGVFIAQDGANTAPNAAQNFKLVPWERIAKALGLPVE